MTIPTKCSNWKLANNSLTNWWCKLICGKTNGKLCERWCLIVEKYGMWTLWLTLGLPLILIMILVYWLIFR
ncbi:MAG: hypothetical protein ACE5KE_04610 [Methanosarcinales archaeon]